MVSATVIAVALAVGLWVRGAVRRHRRRLPATIGHVRIEALNPVCVDGGVFDQVWRIAILMKNIGRQPAPVPPLAARATVRSGSGEYAHSPSPSTTGCSASTAPGRAPQSSSSRIGNTGPWWNAPSHG